MDRKKCITNYTYLYVLELYVIEKNKTNDDGLKRSIIILYGFTQIYPYVRVNQFLSSFEEYNTGECFKLVLCYPGEATDTSFSLFGELKDNHAYRAQILN